MKLYLSPGACSRAVHIALYETGLPFETERVDLKSHTTASGADYYGINPKGYVPCLEIADGTRLTEVAPLLQFVADRAPEKGLAPPNGTFERTRLQEMLHYLATEVHKTMSPLWNDSTPE